MASSDVSTVVNHFSTAAEGFVTTLGSTILSGATTVPLTSTSGLTNGKIFVGIIEPGTVGKEQTFTGVVDTGGNQITGVKWTRGSNTGHNAGVTIVDYVSGTGHNMMTKGLLVEHDQDGTHSAITATSITATTGTFTNLTIAGTASAEGWSPLGATPDTVTAKGNRSYDLVFNANDLTDTLSPGMRVKATRTVTAPTQCADLEASSSHYFNRTSANLGSTMTFTDDFVVSAWVKLESYTAGVVASRYNGTSGWNLDINATGQFALVGYNAASGNYRAIRSYQSLPLNKWVHVAAQLDMSAYTATTTTCYTMIDGVNVPGELLQAGSNPTALIQAGNLEIGGRNGGLLPFDGKIAQVAIYSAKVTQANVLATMAQGLTGSETSLISAYSLSNSLTDLNTGNANNLTAQNSAVATATDTPFAGGSVGTTEYGIVTAATFSTNTTLTVQVPEGYALPTTGGISAVSYSINKIPYGMPIQKDKWTIIQNYADDNLVTTIAQVGGHQLYIPTGAWNIKSFIQARIALSGNNSTSFQVGLSTATGSFSDQDLTAYTNSPGITSLGGNILNAYTVQDEITLASATTYYQVAERSGAALTCTVVGVSGGGYIRATLSYL